MTTIWDALQRAYFNGYAMWTYLTTPFLLAMDGVRVEETEGWREGAETRRSEQSDKKRQLRAWVETDAGGFNNVPTTALTELTTPGGITDPNHFGQNYLDMILGSDGWNLPGRPPCYLKSCSDYEPANLREPSPDFEALYKPAQKAVNALEMQVSKNVTDHKTRRMLMAPLRKAHEYLQQARQTGAETPLHAADEMVQYFIRIARVREGVGLDHPSARNFRTMAYNIHGQLDELINPVPKLPVPSRTP